MNLRPRIFCKLQHHIAKVTGLSQGDLDAGLPMKEGLQFLDWGRPDAELAEWGLDDVTCSASRTWQAWMRTGLTAGTTWQRVFCRPIPAKKGEGSTLKAWSTGWASLKEEPFHNALMTHWPPPRFAVSCRWPRGWRPNLH